MNSYKISVEDKNYETFEITNSNGESIVLDPIKNKLFDGDIFSIDTDIVSITHSPLRQMLYIPAILVLEGNRIFGKTKKHRPLYRCIPDDRKLPEFLVPYTNKIGFNKKIYNKYVLFGFDNWDKKHPEGRLSNVLGSVTELDTFYEYQLYCKGLNTSIKSFTKQTRRQLSSKSEEYFIETIINNYNIVDRRSYNIISIDPMGSKDFDDAYGLKAIDNNTVMLSIYIANVSLWIDALDLWEYFSERVSTIYLPDSKKPMLPTILSDSLCSLQENKTRFAFTLDIYINTTTFDIIKTEYHNTSIIVKKNLRYDTRELTTNTLYQESLLLITNMNNKRKYTESIKSSHDVIAYMMILMNYLTAKKFVTMKKGIFRAVKMDKTYVSPRNIPENIGTFLKTWNSFGGSYVRYKNVSGHEILNFDSYIHITSPIRRLVDLLNIIEFQDSISLFKYSDKSKKFYEKWTNDSQFEYMNTTMRAIRKVQNDCSLLKMCSTDKSIMDQVHVGFIFDKNIQDVLYQYMVYIPKLKMVNRFTSRSDMENNTSHKFKLFAFMDENRLKEKIRIEMVE